MQSRTKDNLDEKVLQATGHPDIGAYCDSILADIKLSSIPVDLLAICKARRITEQKIVPDLSHQAYIEIKGKEFHLTTKKELNLSLPQDRFLLAHEIAHTFQFELKSNVAIDKFFFLNGSKEQEYFSDYIARAILIPTKEIQKRVPEKGTKLNSLKTINSLVTNFVVEYDKCITRLFNDLNFYDNIAILRFIQFTNEKDWKLFESFATNNLKYDKGYFLPSRNFNLEKRFQDRFPSCGALLNTFLDTVFLSHEVNIEQEITISKDIFLDQPLKQFGSKIDTNNIVGHISTKVNSYKSKIVNILLDVEKTSPNIGIAASGAGR